MVGPIGPKRYRVRLVWRGGEWWSPVVEASGMVQAFSRGVASLPPEIRDGWHQGPCHVSVVPEESWPRLVERESPGGEP